MDIGKPTRTYTIEPIENPVPREAPPEPTPEPERNEPIEPEKVPATSG